jgi:hypothetical protein
MKVFKDYVFTWWQVGLLKLSLLSAGLFIGSMWPSLFSWPGAYFVLAALCIVPAVYLAAAALKQAS